MSIAAMNSPFDFVDHGAPWILWTQKEPLSLLQAQIQTDGRYENISSYIQPTVSLPQIQFPKPNRYHAVLSKIDQATRHTGTYSSWMQ